MKFAVINKQSVAFYIKGDSRVGKFWNSINGRWLKPERFQRLISFIHIVFFPEVITYPFVSTIDIRRILPMYLRILFVILVGNNQFLIDVTYFNYFLLIYLIPD